jgi:hypothetical protein
VFTPVNSFHAKTVERPRHQHGTRLETPVGKTELHMINRTKALAILFLAAGVTAASAQADFKLERALKLEPGGSFVLETDIGSVVLTGESASGARVVVTSDIDLDRDYDFAFTETARAVKVTIKRRGMRRLFSGWFGDHDTRVTIQVPTRTDVNLNTSGGSIRASRVNGLVGVHTSGGSLDVDSIEGNVDGTTSGGGIRMRTVRGDVVASTSGAASQSPTCAAAYARPRAAAASPSTRSPVICAPRQAAAA